MLRMSFGDVCTRMFIRSCVGLALLVGAHRTASAQSCPSAGDCAKRWLGSELAGDVRSTATWRDATNTVGIVAGGSFNVGSSSIIGVAFWNGFRWRPLGRGVVFQSGADAQVNVVHPIAVDGDIFVGGKFDTVIDL